MRRAELLRHWRGIVGPGGGDAHGPDLAAGAAGDPRVPGRQRPPGLAAKDIALAIVAELGSDGANYQAIEFAGEALAALTLEDRLVLSNLMVEAGAKAAIFPHDAERRSIAAIEAAIAARLWRPTDAPRYARGVTCNLTALTPRVALPHAPDRVVPIEDAAGVPLHMVCIGTCTGGRVVDFHDALDAFRRAGGRLAPGVQLVLTPASREVHDRLIADGTIETFVRAGAAVTMPGCGACCGTSGIIPGDNMTVLSTANRNFKARMGNATASIYSGVTRRLRPCGCDRPDSGAAMTIDGRARVFGDDVNTDYIISSSRKRQTIDTAMLKRFLFESIAPDFAASVEPGDLLVAGTNFGCGSAMEVAATVIQAAGIRAVLARSFARSFYRNAINNGLVVVECDTSTIGERDRLSVELADGGVTTRNLTRGGVMTGAPFPPIMLRILEHGGLVEFLAAHGGFDR